MALYNSNGNLHARYEYDAWGKLLSIKDANGDDITNTGNFAIVNPFRYRGYCQVTRTYVFDPYELPSSGFKDQRMKVVTAIIGMTLFAGMFVFSRTRRKKCMQNN